MSEFGFDSTPSRAGGHRADRPKKSGRGTVGCAVVLVLVVALVVAGWLAWGRISTAFDNRFGSDADYSGTGTGSVQVTVNPGDSLSAIGETLHDADVVASAEAFVGAADDNAQATAIQPGVYTLKKQMSADNAVKALLNEKNRGAPLQVLPGSWADEVAKDIAKHVGSSTKKVKRVIRNPRGLALPRWAKGHVEGFLAPGEYAVSSDATARTVLAQMVGAAKQEYDQLGVKKKASRLGLTPLQVITMASIVEAETRRASDRPKVARVLYNRLHDGMHLQLDSTIAYLVGVRGEVYTTPEQRETESPYNTYLNAGLPPAPIGNPSVSSVRAVLNPAKGKWLFFVTVNPETGRTLFARTYAQHVKNDKILDRYCEKSDVC